MVLSFHHGRGEAFTLGVEVFLRHFGTELDQLLRIFIRDAHTGARIAKAPVVATAVEVGEAASGGKHTSVRGLGGGRGREREGGRGFVGCAR